MKNCWINNTYAQDGSIIYSQENYNGHIDIEKSIFNNENNLFFLFFSQISLIKIDVKNNVCTNNQPGCLIYSESNSSISLNLCNFLNVSSYEEGILYLDSSQIYIEYLKMMDLYSQKQKGVCASLYNSTFEINNSFIQNYQINCFHQVIY